MEMNWQMVAAVLVVGIAVWHLMRRAFAVLHAPGSNSCGGCSKCPDPDENLVELHELGKVSPPASQPAQSIRATKN